jgi:hypothetical protein
MWRRATERAGRISPMISMVKGFGQDNVHFVILLLQALLLKGCVEATLWAMA